MDRLSVLLALSGDSSDHVDALRRAGFEPFTDMTEAAARAAAGRIDLAVLDCDLSKDQLTSVSAALHAGASIPTILLVDREIDSLPVEVSSSAAAEIAFKPVPAEALVYRLQALLIRTGRSLPAESGGWADTESLSQAPIAGEGHVVSVFAPKGGVGKTTVAVNMAVALREQTRAQVLLLDADVGVGNVTAVLEVPVKLGLADLADSAPEEWTDAAFEHATTTHADSGVRVLIWGNDPAQSERVTVDLLLAAVRWARNHHSYIVVDNHPGYDDRTMAMLTVANEIFMVVTPEVGAIRNSSQFLDLARELGLAGMIKVIVNRANHGIRLDDMAKSFGLPISASVVSNGPKAIIAANEGKPVISKFPREKIATDLHAVARLISQPSGVATTPATARPWWMRIGTRTSNA